MILAGGNPDAMKLGHFLDAAYVLIFQEFQRLGMSLEDTIEQTKSWQAGFTAGGSEEPDTARSQRGVISQNDLALAQLEKQLAGIR